MSTLATIERADKSSPATTARVLVVDDDCIVADSLAEFLRTQGHEAITCLSGEEALDLLEQSANGDAKPIQLVVCDLTMPGMNGLTTLRRISERHPDVCVLMVTGYATVESAVEALKAGAIDYLTKPIVDDELRLAVQRALRQQAIVAENVSLRRQLENRFALDNVVGRDHRMLQIFDLIDTVATSRTTVLITGESGSGKSMIARAIHQRSQRSKGPFVSLACGSIPETLLESELFGHSKGAFTGAHADKQGRFQAADGGTIFLDEINSASQAMQLKLLRVLQERRFEPVGSTETIEIDVRVVLASNQPLERLVELGEFRRDLYYRVNVVRLEIPPLRERPSDIPLLAEHFLQKQSAELGRQIVGFSNEAMDALRRYSFPGNVRELENVIERAALLSRSPTIDTGDLPPYVLDNEPQLGLAPHVRAGLAADDAVDSPDTPWVATTLQEALREPERRILLKALRANDWKREQTADQLGINRTTLYKKIKALGLEKYAS